MLIKKGFYKIILLFLYLLYILTLWFLLKKCDPLRIFNPEKFAFYEYIVTFCLIDFLQTYQQSL